MPPQPIQPAPPKSTTANTPNSIVPSPTSTVSTNDASSPKSPFSLPPHHKSRGYHRRGPLACDECRLRKRRCDGGQPCAFCVTIQRDCTFEARGAVQTPTQRIRALEDKIRRARTKIARMKSDTSAGGGSWNGQTFQNRVDQVTNHDADLGTGNETLIDEVLMELDLAVKKDEDATVRTRRRVSHRQSGSESATVVSTPASVPSSQMENMMFGRHQIVSMPQTGSAVPNFRCFTSLSAFAYICRVFEMFSDPQDQISLKKDLHPAVLRLYEYPKTELVHFDDFEPHAISGDRRQKRKYPLPVRSTMIELIGILWRKCVYVGGLLLKPDVDAAVERCYAADARQEIPETRSAALLHTVLALAHMYDDEAHRTHGCHSVGLEGYQHFEAACAIMEFDRCDDLVSLQILLVMLVYLVTTSRLLSARTYMAIACATASKVSLHSPDMLRALSTNPAEFRNRLRMGTMLIHYDNFLAIHTGESPFLKLDELDSWFNFARERVAISPDMLQQGPGGGRPGFQQLYPAYRALRVLDLSRIGYLGKLTIHGMVSPKTEKDAHSNKDHVNDNKHAEGGVSAAAMVDSSKLEELDASFRQWLAETKPILALLQADRESGNTSLKIDMELVYYSSQMILYQPFLHYLRNSAPTRDQQANVEAEGAPRKQPNVQQKASASTEPSSSQPQRIYHALVCLKAASTIIKRAEAMMEPDNSSSFSNSQSTQPKVVDKPRLFHPASWVAVHSVFQAVLCLIFLVAGHTGISKPSQAWLQAESGIRILVSLRCGAGGAASPRGDGTEHGVGTAASACVDILKIVTRHLPKPVRFDFEHLEMTTMPVCGHQPSRPREPGSKPRSGRNYAQEHRYYPQQQRERSHHMRQAESYPGNLKYVMNDPPPDPEQSSPPPRPTYPWNPLQSQQQPFNPLHNPNTGQQQQQYQQPYFPYPSSTPSPMSPHGLFSAIPSSSSTTSIPAFHAVNTTQAASQGHNRTPSSDYQDSYSQAHSSTTASMAADFPSPFGCDADEIFAQADSINLISNGPEYELSPVYGGGYNSMAGVNMGKGTGIDLDSMEVDGGSN